MRKSNTPLFLVRNRHRNISWCRINRRKWKAAAGYRPWLDSGSHVFLFVAGVLRAKRPTRLLARHLRLVAGPSKKAGHDEKTKQMEPKGEYKWGTRQEVLTANGPRIRDLSRCRSTRLVQIKSKSR